MDEILDILVNFKMIIISKYKWKIRTFVQGSNFPVFIAAKENSNNNYYCIFVDKDDKEKILKIIEECKNYTSIISIEDLITVDNITYVFFENIKTIDNLYSIDESKLLKLFIEIYDINNSDDVNLLTNTINRIVIKDGEYKIDLLSIYKRSGNKRNDISLISNFSKIFEKFNLKKTTELKKIKFCIIGMDKEGETAMRKGFLRKELECLLRLTESP